MNSEETEDDRIGEWKS